MQFSNLKILITLLCLWFFTACSNEKIQNGEEPLARVYDKYLYPSNIQNLLSENINPEDSLKIVEEYIDNWIRHNLVLKIAEDNLQSRLSEIEKQAKDYKESLLIYAYEKQWLSENLDTLVNDDSIQAYYLNHPQEFILKQDIFRLSYAIVGKTIKSYDSLRTWFSKDINEFRNELEVYCLNNCRNYIFDSQNWFSEDALFKMLPLQIFENKRLHTTGIIEHTDETNKYIVKVHEIYSAGTEAPFEYVQNDVRQIIIGKRKMEILKNNYQHMYSEGFKKAEAEIFKKEKPAE
ncbi:MAG: hypothetical protein H7Y00_16430 [Fimbriimonadaceae bacterium]|nr:hypothetical protein [Chitinophagales bacterium]